MFSIIFGRWKLPADPFRRFSGLVEKKRTAWTRASHKPNTVHHRGKRLVLRMHSRCETTMNVLEDISEGPRVCGVYPIEIRTGRWPAGQTEDSFKEKEREYLSTRAFQDHLWWLTIYLWDFHPSRKTRCWVFSAVSRYVPSCGRPVVNLWLPNRLPGDLIEKSSFLCGERGKEILEPPRLFY